MSLLKKSIVFSVFIIAMSGCGLKGDLYMPEAQPQVVDSTPLDESSEAVTNIPDENIETTEEVVQPE
jgi:predicted small lipoprotein YifL